MEYSADQARARDRILAVLHAAGVDRADAALLREGGRTQPTLAVIGKAGSGKTMLLADLVRGLVAAGVETISSDFESRRTRTRRTLAVLAQTNKAASVLRQRGVPATTIHRILYTPLYHPDYEAIAEWLTGKGDRPKVEGMTDVALDRALAFYQQHASIPGALATAGLRGSDFIQGWKRRDEPLDIGLIDEASMLDARQYSDLRELFRTLILFGDPAQLAPVGGTGGMVFDDLPESGTLVGICCASSATGTGATIWWARLAIGRWMISSNASTRRTRSSRRIWPPPGGPSPRRGGWPSSSVSAWRPGPRSGRRAPGPGCARPIRAARPICGARASGRTGARG
jgi:hypothetical protein